MVGARQGGCEARVESCALCIVGAGIAGLNALVAAADYLGAGDRVILVDRNEGPGGMWSGVYDFVRLHQPYRMFTAGDIAWTLRRPPEYLANADEVRAHMAACLSHARAKLDLAELFGHEVSGCEEIETADGTAARLQCHPAGHPDCKIVIQARRAIKATGFDVPEPKPLPLSSRSVLSTTPEALVCAGEQRPEAPIYVVGGGKTGMDTAQAALRLSPRRPVMLVAGRGTMFVDRDRLFPLGLRRYWTGTLVYTAFRDLALTFDGTNEDAVFAAFKSRLGLGIVGDEDRFLFGILSPAERDEIAAGLHDYVRDYLVDVVDGEAGPEAVLRGGARLSVEPQSLFVNCTGRLLRTSHSYEPYLSPGGAVLSINPRSMIQFFTSMASFLLTHLFLRAALRDVPFYELDGEAALARDRRLYHTAALTLSFANSIAAFGALAMSVLRRCGLDMDRWYPLHRRGAALIDMVRNGQRYLDACHRSLDRVHEIHGIRCGPLTTGRTTRPSSWE